ncbi:MAG: 3'-5' exonuclease, partial [Chitinophagaceae bacterium]
MLSTPLNHVLVIDIETASNHDRYNAMDAQWQMLWNEKVSRSLPEGVAAEEWYSERAGVMAEFGRVVCVSMAIFTGNGDKTGLKIRSVSGTDERKILEEVIGILNNLQNAGRNVCFAGHNIREFDIPFLSRRMIIHGLSIPACMNFQNKKPWEISMLDTFQHWRFGDYKNYTSLKLLAASLGLPSPKEEIDGSMVGPLFWEKDPERQQENLRKITAY